MFQTSVKLVRDAMMKPPDVVSQEMVVLRERVARTGRANSPESIPSCTPKRRGIKDRLVNPPEDRFRAMESRIASKNPGREKADDHLINDKPADDKQEIQPNHLLSLWSKGLRKRSNDEIERSPITRSQRSLPKTRRQQIDEFVVPDEPPQPRGYSKTHGLGEQWKKPLVYPLEGKKKATVEWSDLEKLDEGEYLNDNLLGFYLRYLEHKRDSDPEAPENIYWFNTFFYTSLTKNVRGKGKINYDAVRKWTRSVDLFSFDYVVVPINENLHWYLAIICNLSTLKRAPMPLVDDDEDMLDKENVSNTEEAKELVERDVDMSIIDIGVETEEDPPRREADPNEQLTRESFAEMQLDDVKRKSPLIVAIDTEDAQSPIHKNKEQVTQGEVLEIIRTEDSKVNRLLQIAHKKVEASPKSGKGKRKPKFDPDYPTIMTLDSLGLSHPVTVKILKTYLQEEANDKRGGMSWDDKAIHGMTAQEIPRQSNYWDCGLYVLGYAAKFMADPREFVVKMCTRAFDVVKDWPALDPSNMRTSTRQLIFDLHKEQHPKFYIQSEASTKVASAPTKQDAKALVPSQGVEKEEAKKIEVEEPSKGTKIEEASKKVQEKEQPKQMEVKELPKRIEVQIPAKPNEVETPSKHIAVEEQSERPEAPKLVKTLMETDSKVIKASPDPPPASKVHNGEAASQAISIDDSALESTQPLPIEELRRISPMKIPGAFADDLFEDDDNLPMIIPDSQEGK